jgi:tetratricopeptide (TPR) repeat protein
MTSVTRTTTCVAFLLCLLAFPASARDLISIEQLFIHPDTSETRETVHGILSQAVYAANQLYGEELLAVDRGQSAPAGEQFDTRFTLSINAVRDESNSNFYMTMSDGSSESNFSVFGTWEDVRPDYVAQAIYTLRGAVAGFPDYSSGAPPEYVGELPFTLISQYYVGGPIQYAVPYSAAAGSGGALYVAGGQVAFELGPYMSVEGVIGMPLAERGISNAAYAVGATEAGTVYLRPAAGPYIYRFHPAVEQPDRFRVQLGAGGTIAALTDGSLLLSDPTSQTISRMVEGRSERLSLFLEGYGGVVAPGPDGNIWAMDTVRRRVGIYSTDGELLDTIVPIVPQTTFYSTRAMAVTGDGAAIVLTHDALWRVERNGRVAWKLEAGTDSRLPPFQAVNSLTVDRESGAVYLVDISGQRIVRLLDPSSEHLSAEDRRLLELSAAAYAGDTDALQQQAELYEELGAYEMALSLWDELGFADPSNDAARRGRRSAELLLLTDRAARLDRQTRNQLEAYGPESARTSFSQAIQAYERALSIADGDRAAELQTDKQHLQERYERGDAAPANENPPLEVASFVIDDLFPSLLPLYQARPAGRVVIRNSGDAPAADVTVELNIRRYMDFPTTTDPVSDIPPGGEAEIPISVPLSREVLNLEEQMPAQAQITLRYRSAGGEFQENRTTRVTIHRRTALSWDDSGKLASFVTPNEEVVSRFAHRVVSEAGRAAGERVSAGAGDPPSLGRVIDRASRIADALGVHGMAYIQDPDTPISAILGDSGVVDTVRFPRTTLLYRSGDCDDTTALVCSLYESVGIRTAILTSPAHVFMAFDTGEPETHEWMFENEELEAIRHNGTLWLPVETTVLDQGFYTAWREASALYRRHEPAGDIEFLPLSGAWQEYRPVPLSPATFELVEPSPERVTTQFSRSVEEVRERLYRAKVDEIEHGAEHAPDSRSARQLNRLGVLHARYGSYDEAVSAFERSIDLDSRYASPLINLANTYILTGRPAQAIPVLQGASPVRERDRVHVNLTLAQVYSELGRQADAEHALQRVAEQSPRLAERYSYLAQRPDSDGSRASQAAGGPQVLWAADVEDE